MKKVAYVIRPAEGGMLKHLIDLIANLDRERFSPVVISPPGNDLALPLGRIGAELIEVDIADKPNLGRDMSSIAKLATGLTAVSPDILHAHSNKAALLTEMAVRRGSIATPVVFSMHNFPSYRAAAAPRRAVSSLAMRRVINGCARVIAVSGSLRDYLVESEHVDSAKITVIHNGVDMDEFKPASAADVARLRQDLGLSPSTPVIGAVSRLVHFKGIDVFISAVPELIHKFPGLKIIIVGDGPLEQTLRAQTASLGLMRDVIFTGRVPDQRPYYGLFDVFVLPSRQEPFGLVVLEAMASGCPVVATRSGGVPEIIDNRDTGLLVPSDDPHALARSIRALLSDRKEAREMAARACANVGQRFSLRGMAEETQRVYDTVLNEASNG